MESLKNTLFKTARRYLPKINSLFNRVPDPRNPNKTTYPMRHLLWTGVLLFMLKLGSRRRLRFKFNTIEFAMNLARLAGVDLEKVAHPDTLADLLEVVPPEQLFALPAELVRGLLRTKALEKYRLLDDYYLLAFDATGVGSSKKRHCEHCLTQTVEVKNRKGKTVKRTVYYHLVLSAKLVTYSGLALPIASEWVENPGPNPDKQDCELKAFYRLAPRVHELFPQLGICVVLDGEFAGKPTFDLCEKCGWKYLVVFKEGSMPATFREFETLKGASPENTRKHCDAEGCQQVYRWVNDLDYEGHKLSVLECLETKGENSTRWVWLTNLPVTYKNCVSLGNGGGRQRWKIENQGFQTQKCGGYNLEHAYSEDYQGMKNFYILLQLGHLVNQLMEHGHLLKPVLLKTFGSLRDFTEELREELRRVGTSAHEYAALLAKPFQIRLDTS